MYFGLLGLALALCLPIAPAHAQATRTWVSGVGDDANPCSRTAPCKTFAGAISKTATGGEINVLDPGGFGAVTITKSITISSEGFEAGVLVSGTNGIVISGAGINVILRGLDIEGLGTGLVGVNILAASAVHVEKCTIRSFNAGSAAGIMLASSGTSLFVSDTIITENGTGAAGGGIVVQSGGVAVFTVSRSHIDNNSHAGITLSASTIVSGALEDSIVSHNVGDGVTVGANALLTIDRSLLSFNSAAGVNASSATVPVRIGNSTITGSATGVAGNAQSWKNNQIFGNTTDGTPITQVPGGLQ
jgi:hypothetical protein